MNALDTLSGSTQDLPFFIRLPFVREAKTRPGRCYWTVNSTGDYHHDLILGEAMAQYALRHLRSDDDPDWRLLAEVVLEMMEAGRDSVGKGAVVGFFGTIGQAITSMPRRVVAAPVTA